jgi:hypothetical protein
MNVLLHVQDGRKISLRILIANARARLWIIVRILLNLSMGLRGVPWL